eukprot:1863329-Rhodomonas_salina.2
MISWASIGSRASAEIRSTVVAAYATSVPDTPTAHAVALCYVSTGHAVPAYTVSVPDIAWHACRQIHYVSTRQGQYRTSRSMRVADSGLHLRPAVPPYVSPVPNNNGGENQSVFLPLTNAATRFLL